MSTDTHLGNEEWRQVPSISALLVSSLGRVTVKPFTGTTPQGHARSYGGKPSFGQWAAGSGGGRYIIVYRGHSYKIARLVCEAFHGPAPDGHPNALHRDENARNNCATNLRWGTQKERLNQPGFIAYCKGRTGANSPRTKGMRKLRQASTQPETVI